MRTAKEFAQFAAQCEQFAQRIALGPAGETRPLADQYEVARNTAVYHLRQAATKARSIAEHMAKTEAGK